MLSFQEARSILDELAEGLPPGIFERLNGGIVLLPEEYRSPESPELLVLGQYRVERYGLGRYIVIYYGSLRALFAARPDAGTAEITARLREVLYHELTHHIESLAGDGTLAQRDASDLEQWRREREGTP